MADQLGCRQHRYTAVDQRLHVEVVLFIMVDRTTNASYTSGCENVPDLTVAFGEHPAIFVDASQFEAPKLSPERLRGVLPSEINPFLYS